MYKGHPPSIWSFTPAHSNSSGPQNVTLYQSIIFLATVTGHEPAILMFAVRHLILFKNGHASKNSSSQFSHRKCHFLKKKKKKSLMQKYLAPNFLHEGCLQSNFPIFVTHAIWNKPTKGLVAWCSLVTLYKFCCERSTSNRASVWKPWQCSYLAHPTLKCALLFDI